MPRRTVVDPRFPARLRELLAQRDMSYRALAARTHYGKSYLHELATGKKAPAVEIAARLDDALNAGGQLAIMVSDDDGPLAYAMAHPRRADAAAVDELAAQLVADRLLEDSTGAAPMLPAATRQLDIVTGLVREARGPVRPQLVTVAAQWAQFGGWLNLARGQPRRAGALFDRALEWAIEVNERELIATVLSFKGHAAWLAGDLGPMIGLTEAALRDPDVYVGQRAYDRYQLARGQALGGDQKAAGDSLAAAADLVDETAEYAGQRPAWHYYRSRAFYALEAGIVYQLLGDNAAAADLLRAGLAGLPPQMQAADWTAMYRKVLAEASAGS